MWIMVALMLITGQPQFPLFNQIEFDTQEDCAAAIPLAIQALTQQAARDKVGQYSAQMICMPREEAMKLMMSSHNGRGGAQQFSNHSLLPVR